MSKAKTKTSALAEAPEPQPSSPDTVLIKATSLQAYFHETLHEARREHLFEATEASEHYIVTLLEAFGNADRLFGLDEQGQRKDEALAMILHEAVFDLPTQRIEHYRRLGDMALYTAGVFADSLRRRTVDITYYVSMGQGAYGSLANLLREQSRRALREVFTELADTFSHWVEVLRDVSERLGLSVGLGDQDTAELYARLPALSGPRAGQVYGELASRGALPGFRGMGRPI